MLTLCVPFSTFTTLPALGFRALCTQNTAADLQSCRQPYNHKRQGWTEHTHTATNQNLIRKCLMHSSFRNTRDGFQAPLRPGKWRTLSQCGKEPDAKHFYASVKIAPVFPSFKL